MTNNANENEPGIVSEYRQTLILRILCLITIIPLGILFVLATLIDHGSFIWFSIGGVFLLVSILVWINGFTFRLHLHNSGMDIKNIFGHRHVQINENTKFFHRNVREFINGVPAGQHVFITVKHGANSIRLNSNIKNINLLQQELINLEMEHVLPYCESQYRCGARVDFGSFQLQLGTLIYKNKSISLKDISGLLLQNGKLKISQINKRFSFCNASLSEIANMTSFFTLLENATTESST